jgi:hypothetical protein
MAPPPTATTQPRLVDGTLMVQTAENPYNNFHLRKVSI